ncbi:FRIGIDA-like protein 3 isoform X2 [Camellia sinensis]|nr:FRIGIDA-like protein 3 isoform X2 [Camellia sinensis]XP_028052200.1 FRIGIDA-like protein 3 isoform X2 [Camellia sinensis]
MADRDQVVGIDATISLIEQLAKSFLELKAHKDAAEDNVQWSEIEEYFQHLETMTKKKIEELALREKDFKEKESETCTLLAQREAAVAAKEQDLLDRIQELKDAAVAAIAEARTKHEPEPLKPIDGGDGKETKVSSSLGDTNALLDVPEENSPNKTGENAEGVAAEVKPRPELTQFCEQMDAKGLLNYTMEHQKNISAIRVELSVALESATEPGHLVLASLEGFYPPDDTTTQEGDKRDAALRGLHLSCIMFMEAMATLLARADPGADHLLNPEIKQQAKAIADEWKPKLAGAAGTDAANAKNSLEAEAFLQLLATFSIALEFDEEELCKHVLVVAHKRRAPELCRSLGLAHKMPGVVEALVNSGRQIDAVHFIHAFELTERFPAVPLLKTYLKDLRRNSQGKPSNSGGAAGAQNDANAQELAALRAVIRCVKEYKLGADYPLDPLQKRVTQLERSKPDKKRSGESGKHQQFKKPRNGGFHGFRSPASAPVPAPTGGGDRQGAPAVFAKRAMYAAGIAERYPPHAVPSTYDYQTPSQPTYAQQPPYDQRSYYYTQDDRVSAASTYNAAPPSYGSYVGSGMQSSHQQYM